MTGDNLYAVEARTRKAITLVDEARRAGFSAQAIAEREEVRENLIRIAGVRPASTETWAMVVAMLEAEER